MVHHLNSADALPFDLIPLFFHWLINPGDLASVALVCRTWHQAATVRLYSVVVYSLELARQAGRMMSPFRVILAHPEYALHVKYLVIRSVPTFSGRPDNQFILDLMKCMELFRNLISFSCTAPGVLPSIVQRLATNKPRLTDLKLGADLNRPEMELMLALKTLKSIVIDSPTRVALHYLPKLVEVNLAQLQSLSITNSSDLDRTHLQTILACLPDLQSLQISNCLQITHTELLRIIGRTAPLTGSSLTSLSLTVYTSSTSPDPMWPTLLALKNLTIFVRQCNKDFYGDTIKAILSCAGQAALESLTLRHSEKVGMTSSILDTVVKDHRSTLKRMNVINFSMSAGQVEKICIEMHELVQLAFYMTMGTEPIASAIAKAKKLTTLIDTQSGMGHAGGKTSFTFRDIHRLFVRSAGTLKTVKITSRTYTGTWKPKGKGKDKKDELSLTMVRDKFPFIYEFDVETGSVKEVPGTKTLRLDPDRLR